MALTKVKYKNLDSDVSSNVNSLIDQRVTTEYVNNLGVGGLDSAETISITTGRSIAMAIVFGG